MMRQRTVVWDSKCEVCSVCTPFGEVQIFCPFWVAALIGNKEICFREITQFPSSVDNVFFRVCQVNSIQMTENSNGGHRCWLFCKDVQYTSMPTFDTFFQTCILEGFFQRVLGFYTHKFPKCSAASFTDIPELHLCLWELVCKGNAA